MKNSIIKFMTFLAVTLCVMTACSSDDDEKTLVLYSYGVETYSFAGQDVLGDELKRFEQALNEAFDVTDNSFMLKKGQSESDLIATFNKVAKSFVPTTGLETNGHFSYSLYRAENGKLKTIATTPLYEYSY